MPDAWTGVLAAILTARKGGAKGGRGAVVSAKEEIPNVYYVHPIKMQTLKDIEIDLKTHTELELVQGVPDTRDSLVHVRDGSTRKLQGTNLSPGYHDFSNLHSHPHSL